MTISQAQKDKITAGYKQQIAYCEANDAPLTARICRAIINVADESTRTGSRIMNWQGEVIPDALPLRSTAPFHALYQSGKIAALNPIYNDAPIDQNKIDKIINATLRKHDDIIYPWLDTPPQTNEPGRCAALMLGLMMLVQQYELPIDILEIGSSAGLNLMIDRYAFDLGGIAVGPKNSEITIKPEWRGKSVPPDIQPEIISTKGVDLYPMYANEDNTRERLLAYVWPEQTLRLERTAKAIKMAQNHPVNLVQGDAADWLEKQLSEPQKEGTMRTLMHSIVWQYLPYDTQRRIAASMLKAAQKATHDKPLAWVSLETNRTMKRHELKIRSWPNHDEAITLGYAHAHGFWVDWL